MTLNFFFFIFSGFRCWDSELFDINDELAQIANKADLGEEGPNGKFFFLILKSLICFGSIGTHRVGGNCKRQYFDDHRSKIIRNRVFDCHLSPDRRQMAIENTISSDFSSLFIDC